jgi:hypothetical protein
LLHCVGVAGKEMNIAVCLETFDSCSEVFSESVDGLLTAQIIILQKKNN